MANGKKEAEESKKEEKREEEKKEPQNSEKELSDVKDRLLRLAAEFDNYKKKAAKEVDGAKDVGKAELIKALLPTLDEFELALLALSGSEDKGNIKGIELVFSNVLCTLKNTGMKEVEAKGKCDPYKHEIIMARESKEPEGTILEVVRKGYTLDDALLRPSAVIVSKGNVSKQEEKGE